MITFATRFFEAMHGRPWRLGGSVIAAAVSVLALIALPGCTRSPKEEVKQAVLEQPAGDAPLAVRLIVYKNMLQQDPFSADARFGLGMALLEQADPRAAELELSKALELGLDPNVVVPVLARVWLQIGRFKDLVETYGATELTRPTASAELKAALAHAHANLRNPAKARELAAAALQTDPKSAHARVLQAQIMMSDSKVDEAQKLIESVLADHPQSVDAWEQKGDILLMARADVAGATQAYEKALAVDSRRLTVHAKLISLGIESKDMALAQSRLDDLVKAAPGSLPRLYFEALVKREQGDLRAARESIQLALSGYPKDLRTLLLAAEIELTSGSLRTAEEHLGVALTVGPTTPKTRYLLAQTYLRSGAPDKAAVIVEPLLRSNPKDSVALGVMAEAAMQHGLYMRAQSLYERAAAIDPENPRFRTQLALGRIAKGDLAGGFGELESAAASDPTANADMALLTARLRAGDFNAATKAAESAARKQPKRPHMQWVLGRLKQAAGRTDEARKYFERALELDKAYVPAALALAELDLGANEGAQAKRRMEEVLAQRPDSQDALLAAAEVRYQAGDSNQAVTAALEAAVRMHGSQPRPWLALVEHLLRIGEPQAALLAAQKATGELPEDLKVLDALGRAQAAVGETAQALATFRSISTLRPRAPQPHTRMADVYLARNEIDSAIESMKAAVALQPTFLPAQVRLAGLAVAKKDWKQALAIARTIQQRLPRDPTGFRLEGVTFAGQKQWPLAVAAFRNAAQRAESSELTRQLYTALVWDKKAQEADRLASAWIGKHPKDNAFLGFLGEFALLSQDYSSAERRFRAVLQNDANNVTALNNLAWLLNMQAKPEALALARKAAELAPGRADVLDTYAMCLANNKQTAQALFHQQRAVEMDPATPGYRLNLARLAVGAKNFPLAREQLDRLSAMGKNFPDQAAVWELRQQLP